MDLAKQLRDITKEDALKSYDRLVSIPCSAPLSFSRAGLQTLDYFFLGHRLATRIKGHSFAENMRNPEMVEFLTDLVRRYKSKLSINYDDPMDLLPHQYSVFQLYYGTVNQFRPAVAKWLYCKLKPKHGILDFSAGWGGRALAAMSLNIPYTGIDTNKSLERAYNGMFDMIKPTSPTKIIISPAETVDYSQFEYDLVFTSPPYFMIERYSSMPEYVSNDDFLNRFFRPVVKEVWKYLKPGGHLALNMPHAMYMACRDLLPPVSKRIRMPKHDRHPQNAVLRKTIGETKHVSHELIYVWHKDSTTSIRKRKTQKRRFF
jgi:tRNA1(Val) A37 N6-methylase TrmN6